MGDKKEDNNEKIPQLHISHLYMQYNRMAFLLDCGYKLDDFTLAHLGCSTRNLLTLCKHDMLRVTFNIGLKAEKVRNAKPKKDIWGGYINLQGTFHTPIGKVNLHFIPTAFGALESISQRDACYVSFSLNA